MKTSTTKPLAYKALTRYYKYLLTRITAYLFSFFLCEKNVKTFTRRLLLISQTIKELNENKTENQSRILVKTKTLGFNFSSMQLLKHAEIRYSKNSNICLKGLKLHTVGIN